MPKKTIHLAIYDTMSDWETGYAIAHINNSDFQKRPDTYQIKTVGATLDPIKTKGGMTIVPDMHLNSLSPSESQMLILPGADIAMSGGIAEFIKTAKIFLKNQVPVAAICGATVAMAQVGLLNECKHTSNAKEFLDVAGYSGHQHYLDLPAITDGNLITASGLAPIEFAVEIFRKLDLYSEQTINSWLALFKDQNPLGFFKLMEEHTK